MSEERELDQALLLVEEYAVAVTKRFGQTTCDEYHLLLAIDEYKSAHFSSLMPGVATACRTRLAANATDQSVEEVDTFLVRKIFRSVTTIEEFWATTQLLASQMANGDSTTGADRLERPTRNVLQLNTPLAGKKDDPTDDSFLIWCASTSGIDELLVRGWVAGDLRFISSLVEGDGEVLSKIYDAELDQNFGSIFATLRALPNSGEIVSVSRHLALGYFNFAYDQASDSEHCGPGRAQVIQDGLRIFLRSRIDESARKNTEVVDVFKKHFDGLYGMEGVKRELIRHVRALVGQRQREKRGLPVGTMTMHLAFLGSPGTGKTEVARRYGKVLKELDLLETGEFNEMGKSDFVDRYMGQTESKTKKAIRKARGGVLFIDEAYSLHDGDGGGEHKSYGQVVIETLVADIENYRGELLCIVAGYAKEMEGFFDANPGLRSRIPTSITFPELSLDELTNIGLLMIAQSDLVVDESFKSCLQDAIAKRTSQKDFGNARGVRNLIDEVRRMQFERLSEVGEFATVAEQNMLVSEDIPEPNSAFGDGNSVKHPMGYR